MTERPLAVFVANRGRDACAVEKEGGGNEVLAVDFLLAEQVFGAVENVGVAVEQENAVDDPDKDVVFPDRRGNFQHQSACLGFGRAIGLGRRRLDGDRGPRRERAVFPFQRRGIHDVVT